MRWIKRIDEGWDRDESGMEYYTDPPERELPASQRLFTHKATTNWFVLLEHKTTKEYWLLDSDSAEAYEEWYDQYMEHFVYDGAFADDVQRGEMDAAGWETMATDILNGRLPKDIDSKTAVWQGDSVQSLIDAWDQGDAMLFEITTPEVAEEAILRILDAISGPVVVGAESKKQYRHLVNLIAIKYPPR